MGLAVIRPTRYFEDHWLPSSGRPVKALPYKRVIRGLNTSRGKKSEFESGPMKKFHTPTLKASCPNWSSTVFTENRGRGRVPEVGCQVPGAGVKRTVVGSRWSCV